MAEDSLARTDREANLAHQGACPYVGVRPPAVSALVGQSIQRISWQPEFILNTRHGNVNCFDALVLFVS